jgi:dihydrofolate reductase
LPTAPPPALAAAVAAANAGRHDWLAREGRPDRTVRHGHHQRLADPEVRTTDPDATPMQTRGGARLGDRTHSVVDGGKARIILATLVTPAEVMENQPARELLWRARFRWRLRPRQVTGDPTSGTVEHLVAVEREGIRAHVPLPDRGARTAFSGPETFADDAARDVYVCPRGTVLRRLGALYTERVVRYQAPAAARNACPVRAQCAPGRGGRAVRRSFDEASLDRVRGYHASEAYKKALRKRAVWVEPLFGEAKQWHGLRRFRLRGLPKVDFSRTLKAPLTWPNTELVAQDAVEFVRERKARPSARSMRTLGSLALCRSLLQAGVVDRFRVVVFPVITGSTGRDRIYDGYPDMALDLVASRTFDGRIHLLEYVPTVLAGPPGTDPADA